MDKDKPVKGDGLSLPDKNNLSLPEIPKEQQEGLAGFVKENASEIGGIVADTLADFFSGKVRNPKDMFNSVFGKLDQLEKSKAALNNSSQKQIPENGKDNS